MEQEKNLMRHSESKTLECHNLISNRALPTYHNQIQTESFSLVFTVGLAVEILNQYTCARESVWKTLFRLTQGSLADQPMAERFHLDSPLNSNMVENCRICLAS